MMLSHFHRLKIPYTDECPSGTGPQTPEYCYNTAPHTKHRDKTLGKKRWALKRNCMAQLLASKGLFKFPLSSRVSFTKVKFEKYPGLSIKQANIILSKLNISNNFFTDSSAT